ncbi:MAG: 3-oxoacyl-ACP reductase FabG [Bacilli bacterium]|nr:3-oxoacyl-ACP reductase FabG [Bacilli bacterium]
MVKNKVVVVTGGTRGIGYEIVRLFKENGANVILFGSKEESVNKAQETLKKDGYEVDGFYPNLSSFEEVEITFKEIVKKYGRIDILINNAGISANKKIDDTTSKEFADIMDINVTAIFNTTKAVVPHMKENGGGVILNTSSMVSIYGQPAGVGYPSSKFAVNGLTKSLARELAPYNIRVNAVAPGVTNTDMIASLPKEQIEPLIKSIPLGRIGEPRDIANAFLFLASDMASYITGNILSVDGAARS